MKRTVGLILAIFAFVLITSEVSQAVPAFARQYRLSCSTCHAPFPRLKEYGDEFAGNGFVLDDLDANRYYVDTGDEDLSLLRDFPIGVRMEAHLRYDDDRDNANDFDLRTPYMVKFLSGGALSDNISYYFYMYFDERGEVAGVEDAYIMFNNLFDLDFDIYAGQFQVSDPLFKRELRLTFEDYYAYKFSYPYSRINLAYDRGLMFTLGLPTGTDIIAEVVNGNGLEDAEGGVFDDDEYKCYAGRISQGIGDFLRIGGFYYYGMERIDYMDPSQAVHSFENEVIYWGPDVTLSYQDMVELNVQYLKRTDSELPLVGSGLSEEAEADAYMAELIIMPDGELSKHYGVLVYNNVEMEVGVPGAVPSTTTYETITAHLGHLIRRNIRFGVEYTRDLENDINYGGIGVVFGF